jgi:chemotaxis response regulator CheB
MQCVPMKPEPPVTRTCSFAIVLVSLLFDGRAGLRSLFVDGNAISSTIADRSIVVQHMKHGFALVDSIGAAGFA